MPPRQGGRGVTLSGGPALAGAERRRSPGAGGSDLGLAAALGTGQRRAGRNALTEACGHVERFADGGLIGFARAGQREQHRRENAAAACGGCGHDPLHAGIALGGLERFGRHLGQVIAAVAPACPMRLFHFGGVAAGKAAAAALGGVVIPAGGLHDVPQMPHPMAALLLGQAALRQVAAQNRLGQRDVLGAGCCQHFFTG